MNQHGSIRGLYPAANFPDDGFRNWLRADYYCRDNLDYEQLETLINQLGENKVHLRESGDLGGWWDFEGEEVDLENLTSHLEFYNQNIDDDKIKVTASYLQGGAETSPRYIFHLETENKEARAYIKARLTDETDFEEFTELLESVPGANWR